MSFAGDFVARILLEVLVVVYIMVRFVLSRLYLAVLLEIAILWDDLPFRYTRFWPSAYVLLQVETLCARRHSAVK